MTTRVLALTLLLLVAGLAGCASPAPKQASEPKPAIRLSAALHSPTDITLEWKDRQQGVAGHVVEFATQPHGRYTILQFVPPHRKTFTHPDLMPETPFYYRVRPFFGPSSGSIDTVLPEVSRDEKGKKDDYRWASPRAIPGGPVLKHTTRNASAAAAPTDLKGTVMQANGIKFTWTDHSSDEQGYLLEAKPKGAPDFGVVALIDPDVNSFGLVTLPNEKAASFRVRAFYYGEPSNVVHQRTGAEPSS